MPNLNAALPSIYFPEIRNAVFHADCTLTDRDFHLMRDHHHSPRSYLTRDVPLPDLVKGVDRKFAFSYALLNHHQLTRRRTLRPRPSPLITASPRRRNRRFTEWPDELTKERIGFTPRDE